MRSLFAVTALAVLLGASAARAQEVDDERARAHFQAGASHYDAGQFEEALQEFEQAYELSGRVELFYNYSLCYERLGEFDRAVEYMHRFLHETEEVEDRPAMEQRLRSLQERAERQRRQEGQEEPGPGVPVPALIAFGAAGASLVVTATMGGLALRERNARRDGCSPICTPGQVDKMDRLALVSDIFLGVTIAAAATGVVLWLTGRSDDVPEPPADTGTADHHHHPPRASLWLAPYGGRGGGGLSLSGSF